VQDILIRTLKEDDVDQIVLIYKAITGKQPGDDFKYLLKKQVGRRNSICHVAELDGKVIGFMVSYILTLGFGMEKSAWIANLGVAPDHMGKGVGEKLGRTIFKQCKELGITEMHTSVRWDSTDLLSFFKTLGFDRSNFINLLKKL
jgi:ribosomal protein S18 acetylase RimI-like enzyme